MRAVETRSVALGGPRLARIAQWLQAGSCFAYRLAHLTVPRPVTVCAIALLLFVA